MKIIISGDVADWNINDFNIKKIPKRYLDKIKNADLFIPNLEGPISEKNNQFLIRSNTIKNNFWNLILNVFNKRQPRVYSSNKILNLLKLNKNTLITLANNHLKDCGKGGFEETMEKLNKNKIKSIGAGLNKTEANKEKILKILDKEIILLNYNRIGLRKFGIFANLYGATKNDFGTAYLPYRKIKEKIEKLKNKRPNLFIILILHDGAEMPKTMEKNRLDLNVIESLGANINIIHHPHTHLLFDSKKTFILGDFVFNRPGKLSDNRIGNLLEIDLKKDNSFNYKLNCFNFKNGYPKK